MYQTVALLRHLKQIKNGPWYVRCQAVAVSYLLNLQQQNWTIYLSHVNLIFLSVICETGKLLLDSPANCHIRVFTYFLQGVPLKSTPTTFPSVVNTPALLPVSRVRPLRFTSFVTHGLLALRHQLVPLLGRHILSTKKLMNEFTAKMVLLK